MRITSPFGADTYEAGDHWAICDVCGFKYRRSELRQRWDRALVCNKDWEPRHPQELVRAKKDRVKVADPRSEGADQFRTSPVTQEDL